MAKILYLSQLLPYPPDAGAKVRQYFTLRYLAQRHQVTLVAFTRSDDLPAAKGHLESFCAVVQHHTDGAQPRAGCVLPGRKPV